VATFFKYGILNLLETSGPVQACNGVALPLPLPLPMDKERAVFPGIHWFLSVVRGSLTSYAGEKNEWQT
jgi:hypothetical protein